MFKSKFWIALFFLAAAFILANGYENLIENSSSGSVHAKKSEDVEATGEAAIGGPFELVNQKGETVTDETYKGKKLLVFFGFTNCPEVCPNTLMAISRTMEMLENDAEKITPIFITVDHENDNVEQIAKYLESFNPAIQGLTGTQEQLKAAQDAYRVYAQKVEMDSMMGTMYNHSPYVYLMDEENKYLTHFQYNAKPEDIVEKIRTFL